MVKKIGFSIGRLQDTYGDIRALELAAELGADAVDFATYSKRWDHRNPDSVYSKNDAEIIAYFSQLREKANSLGLIISQTHGRLEGFIGNKEADDALIANARLDCLAAATLGAPVCVMHGVTTIHMGKDADPVFMRDLNFDMFTRLLPFAREYGIKIATETFGDATGLGCVDFFGDIGEFVDSYRRIAAVSDFQDWFVVCVDTGHSHKATRFGQPGAADVIRRLGKSIAVVHLNDNDTWTDQHKPPLTGSLDWKDILNALDEVGYNGVYNMEVNLACFGKELMLDTAAFSVKLMRNLLNQHAKES